MSDENGHDIPSFPSDMKKTNKGGKGDRQTDPIVVMLSIFIHQPSPLWKLNIIIMPTDLKADC